MNNDREKKENPFLDTEISDLTDLKSIPLSPESTTSVSTNDQPVQATDAIEVSTPRLLLLTLLPVVVFCLLMLFAMKSCEAERQRQMLGIPQPDNIVQDKTSTEPTSSAKSKTTPEWLQEK